MWGAGPLLQDYIPKVRRDTVHLRGQVRTPPLPRSAARALPCLALTWHPTRPARRRSDAAGVQQRRWIPEPGACRSVGVSVSQGCAVSGSGSGSSAAALVCVRCSRGSVPCPVSNADPGVPSRADTGCYQDSVASFEQTGNEYQQHKVASPLAVSHFRGLPLLFPASSPDLSVRRLGEAGSGVGVELGPTRGRRLCPDAEPLTPALPSRSQLSDCRRAGARQREASLRVCEACRRSG